MTLKQPTDLQINGEHYGEVVRLNHAGGPFVLHLGEYTLTANEARKLATWLTKAAEFIDFGNEQRKPHEECQ